MRGWRCSGWSGAAHCVERSSYCAFAFFLSSPFVEAVDGARASAPRFVLGSHAHAAAVEQGGWLCILNLQSKGVPGAVRHRVELYNLRTDPSCSHDQVDDEFERARQMREGLIAWLNAERRADLTVSRAQHSVELLEAITALGYTTESGGGEGPYYVEDPEDEWCKRFRCW